MSDLPQLLRLLRDLKRAKEERMYPKIKALERQLWEWLSRQPTDEPKSAPP